MMSGQKTILKRHTVEKRQTNIWKSMTMKRRRMIMMLSGQRTIWTKQCEDNQEISVRLAQWSVFTVFTIYSEVVMSMYK